jgi:hypothetical protein
VQVRSSESHTVEPGRAEQQPVQIQGSQTFAKSFRHPTNAGERQWPPMRARAGLILAMATSRAACSVSDAASPSQAALLVARVFPVSSRAGASSAHCLLCSIKRAHCMQPERLLLNARHTQ